MSRADTNGNRTRRRTLIEALAYPTRVMRQHLALEDCPHNGDYAATDPHCLLCDYEAECAWLIHHDESVDLDAKTNPDLANALEFCFGYLDAKVTGWGHDRRSCACEACAWLRRAARLLRKLAAD